MLRLIVTVAAAFFTGLFCRSAIAPIIAFISSIIIAPFAIPFFHKLKFGQEIRDEGPSWHKNKSGTPTMGGAIFIVAVIISSFVVLRNDFKSIMLLYLSVSFGAIGFIDDYIKVVKKRNLGLTGIQKLSMQIVASVLFVTLLAKAGMMPTTLIVPFIKEKIDIGFYYYPLAVCVIISAVNAVNLTDGIDGLASTVTIVVCLFFAAVFKKTGDVSCSNFACITAAALTGFLWFNAYPAKIFMGDTGSLFLGGCVAAMAVSGQMAIILIFAGGMYVLETVSVIIQVASFKLTGKRVFKMSPIHHHFEMCGWSENKIVTVFAVSTLFLCILMYIGIRM